MALVGAAAFALLVGAAGALPPNGPSASIVISQVYGGGGNSAAPLNEDYIELFNRGAAPQSVAGWSVQYASATGTGNFGANSSQLTVLPSTTIPAGGYLLVGEASGTTGAALPTPDVTGTINLSATAGKVTLVTGTSSLGCNGGSAPCSDAQAVRVVDLVGYGNANYYESLPGPGPAPTASNTTAIFRGAQGCADTDVNSDDFATGAPAPRSSATSPAPCSTPPGDQAPSVSSTTPAPGAAGVDPATSPRVTFSEPVTADAGAFSIACTASGPHPATATASADGTTFTLDPTTDFSPSESCTVSVTAAAIHDQDANDPPDTMAGDYSFSFTIAAPVTVTPIHTIQGAAHVSPLVGQSVTTTGIVTAKTSNGFWLQDPNPDSDPATSEGVFVFTSSAPTVAVGDAARVAGTVNEFRPGGSAGASNLSNTELGSPTVTVTSSGNPLPAAIVIGPSGRMPPTEVIEDDATGDVETSGVFDPATDGIDFWESLEGMRIEIDDAVAVGPTNSFGETPVVSSAAASVRTPRGGVVVRPNDFNPERVVADDALEPMPTMNVGDHYSSPLAGVLDYDFGNYFLEPTQPVTAVHDGVTPETTTAAGPDQLSIATFNVENLAPSDPPTKFSRLASIIVGNLASPDIIAVEEVQDNSGATDDGTVDASVTIGDLTSAIQAAGGPSYGYREIDPVNDQDGGQPGGNIRVVYLFRTDRGLAFVDAPGGTSTTADSVTPSGDLAYSPGRIDPGNAAWTASRKPLAGEFTFRGQKLFVIANHWVAKLPDDPLMGHVQPPQQPSEAQRVQQATAVRSFTQSLLAASPSANVVVLGDLNDFQFSDALATLDAAPLHDLIDTLPEDERYTYVYEGNSEALDHILLSDGLFARPFAYQVVHVNSEFADQASDHEPQVVKLTLNRAPTVSAGGPYSVDEGAGVTLSATGSDPDGDPLSYAWDLDGDGTFETSGQSVAYAAGDGPATRTVEVRATDPSGASTTAQAAITIANVPPAATFAAPGSAVSGSTFTVSLASPADPSPADASAGFSYAFDCGSGYSAFGAATSATCTAGAAGSQSVGGEIRDKDGGVREYRAVVAVTPAPDPFDSVCALARATSSKKAVADLVCAELAAAKKEAAAGRRVLEQVTLAAAEVTVRLEAGRAFTAAEAAELIRRIRALA
ncbi:MAG TPA: Ig-like domain-containing protein [Gaiellaceae bacterium]|nr:Ig-like domain-containing protein [Gaiellaceae bacterium]